MNFTLIKNNQQLSVQVASYLHIEHSSELEMKITDGPQVYWCDLVIGTYFQESISFLLVAT